MAWSASISTAPQRIATISIKAPEAAPPADIDGMIAQGRVVLAAAGGARTRRRDPAFAHQRTRDRDAGVQVAWRARQRSGLRRLPGSQQGALAGQRNQAVLEAGAQAHRRHLAHAGDAGRARLVLRRHAGRTRVRRRPLLHADRPEAGRQPRPADDRTLRDEFRALSDEPRPDPAAIALPGRSVRSGPRAKPRSARRSMPRRPRSSASSPSRSTTSTGTTR